MAAESVRTTVTCVSKSGSTPSSPRSDRFARVSRNGDRAERSVRQRARQQGGLRHPHLPAERIRRLGERLEHVRASCDVSARLQLDPVAAVHRYRRTVDRELVGLVASAVAFGNIKTLRAKLEDALDRIGPDVAKMADDELELFVRLHGWKHRVCRGEDLARLLIGARRVQRAFGTLGRKFSTELAETGDLRQALIRFVRAIRDAGGLATSSRLSGRRGAAHILPDPSGASGCKRLLLYLRWMARPADGVDLGLWDVPTATLLVPVDTHVHRLSLNLGLTDRKTLSFHTAQDITETLRKIDPEDPTKFDFALCHLGMSRRCPSRRDSVRCSGCQVRSVCRHWDCPA